jgi:SRSO17 transposase
MIAPSLEAQLQTVQSWDEQLQQIVDTLAPRFATQQTRQCLLAYLQGLLGPVERKNGWQLAEYVGDSTPYRLQNLLSRSRWDADLVREDLQAYVKAHLNDPSGVRVLDETGFLKKGDKSVGVAPQYTGTAHDVVNCQIGVFLCYATAKGDTFLDRALYLPEEWASDWERREEAFIPDAVEFATKPQLGRAMLDRAKGAGILAAWVTGDSVYGADPELRAWLQEQHQAYVLGVHSNEKLFIEGRYQSPKELDLSVLAWLRLSCGSGSKGERVFDWALVDLQEMGVPLLWHKALLIRRSITDPSEVCYYQVFAPLGTPVSAIVGVAGARWRIEECLQGGKGEVGLDEYEVRSFQGWYRHITLSMWAHAFLRGVCATPQEAFCQQPTPPQREEPPYAKEPTEQAPSGLQKRGASPLAVCHSMREFKRRRGLSCP